MIKSLLGKKHQRLKLSRMKQKKNLDDKSQGLILLCNAPLDDDGCRVVFIIIIIIIIKI